MHYCNRKMPQLCLLILILGAFNTLKMAECQLGVVYSPFITPDDDPHSTKSYSLQDVKIMLNLLLNDNFHHISTFSVGAPDEPYNAGSVIKESSSIAKTALAAAQLNKEKNKLLMSVYQGVFLGSGMSQQKLSTEIEVAFEITEAANKIYNGTVTEMILTSNASLQELPSMLQSASTALLKSRALNLTIGLSTPICPNLVGLLKVEMFRKNIIDVLGRFDFIICRNIPTESDYSKGPGPFKNNITNKISEMETALKGLGVKTKVLLETGWASGMESKNPYALVEQKTFWEMMGQWADAEKRIVFMFEAFDNPWRADDIEGNPYSSHYGLWKHLSNEMDYSMGSYTRKISKVETHNAHSKENKGSGKPRNDDVSRQRANDGLSRGISIASFGFMVFMLKLLG